MRAERLAAAAMPAAGIFACYLVLALSGYGAPLPFALCIALGGLAFTWSMSCCRWPAAAEVDRRIEAASALRHRPLATLDDRLANHDPLAEALWRAHRRRAALAVAGARGGWPAPVGPARDPWALRGLLLLLLLAAAITAGPAAPARLAAAFTLPDWRPAGPELDVWITPPPYADAPPLALAAGAHPTVLPGSALAILVNGPRRLPFLAFGHASFTVSALARTSHRVDAVITAPGRLVVGPWWDRLGAWRIEVVPPAPPKLALDNVTIAPDGRVRFAWRATDRYGLASLAVRIAPLGAPAALPQDYALPVTTGAGAAWLDLSDDPLAGLPASPILTAAGRSGAMARLASPLVFTPPPPPLRDTTSQALFLLRRSLALRPGDAAAVAGRLHLLASAPPSRIVAGVALQVTVLADALAAGASSPAAAVRRLGLLIRQIEAAADTDAALAQANEALLRALRQGLAGAPATQAALRDLLRQLDAALARHFAPAGKAGAPPATASGLATLDLATLDRLAERIASDEAAGRKAEAARELQALQTALTALASARPMTAAEAAKSAAATAAARQLAGLVQGEAGLRDQTAEGTATPAGQAALRAGLKAAQAGLAHAGLSPPGLANAGQAMMEAETALSRADSLGAEAAEAEAVRNLQTAAAALDKAARQLLTLGQGGAAPSSGGPDGANGAPDEGASGYQPAANPAGAIEQEIIRKDAAPNLPPPTHQYLRRLLDSDQP